MAGQYFDADPVVASRRATVTLQLPDVHAELGVDRGVFSARRIDPGTMVLLRALPALRGGPVLDLGCGYGAIACALALRQPDTEVWAVDVNTRAVELAAANASGLGLRRIHACTPDAVPEGLRFTAVVANPPIRVGKDALQELLTTWLARLTDDGEAWLVVHRHLGADSLAAWLRSGGWDVQRRASKQGYRVLRVAR